MLKLEQAIDAHRRASGVAIGGGVAANSELRARVGGALRAPAASS